MKSAVTSAQQPAMPNDIQALQSGIKISNLNDSLWHYIQTYQFTSFVLTILASLALEAVLAIIIILGARHTSGQINFQAVIFLIILPIVLFAALFQRFKAKFEASFLQTFAEANSYSFDKNGAVDEAYGTIFKMGHDQKVSDVISGSYRHNSLRLFLYQTIIGYGRGQQRYLSTVVELDLNGKLPQLLLVNKQSHYGRLNVSEAFAVKHKLQLEGDFNDYFVLYAPQGNEIEALQVFSPDTMQLMKQSSKKFSIEFAGNRIYIYANGYVHDTDNLVELFSLAQKLIDKIGPLASRLTTDSAIIEAPTNLQAGLRRSSSKWATGLSIAVFAFSAAVNLLLGFSGGTHNNQSNSQANGTQSPNNHIVAAPAVDSNASPYCGTRTSSDLPLATQQFINATTALNVVRDTVSTDTFTNNGVIPKLDLQNQVAANVVYLKALRSINFPIAMTNDANNYIGIVNDYNNELQQLVTDYPGSTDVLNQQIANTHAARAAASTKLRNDLSLPPSTCSFYEP